MIGFLAKIFRLLSYVAGITAPPPGQDERYFVFLWLGVIVTVLVVAPIIFYLAFKLLAR